jgi:FAD/FMN-containing dehydrogenase
MSDTAKLRPNGVTIDPAAVRALRALVNGPVILRGEAGYASARRVWNGSIDRHPALIVLCTDSADVVAAVIFARQQGLPVAVRSGGHNVAGRGLCDDGLVIDLSRMNRVRVDPAARTVRVEAGVRLGDLDRQTHAHGLAVPAGVVSTTGIAGLALGGGVGWLVRKYGMTCDNILSCEVVTAAGEVLVASATENADLFWGLRGGGGNFGIVTSFLFRAHPVSTVLGGLIVYPRDQAAAVIRHYRAVMATAPDELTAYAALLATPDGMPAVAIAGCYCGDPAEGERVLAPLRGFRQPLIDSIQPLPFPEMQRLIDDTAPDGHQYYWKSCFLDDLSDAAIDILIAHAARASSPLSTVVIELYGGAAARVAPGDTAVGERRALFNIGILGQSAEPDRAERHVVWARDLWTALQPHATGSYLGNFASDEGGEAVRAAFGANYARLAALKAKYDPDNILSLNQQILPAS